MTYLGKAWHWWWHLRSWWKVASVFVLLAALGSTGSNNTPAPVTNAAHASATPEDSKPTDTPKPTKTPTPAPTPQAFTASFVCILAHDVVKAALKAPSTAKFPDNFCTDVRTSKTVDANGHNVWTGKGPSMLKTVSARCCAQHIRSRSPTSVMATATTHG